MYGSGSCRLGFANVNDKHKNNSSRSSRITIITAIIMNLVAQQTHTHTPLKHASNQIMPAEIPPNSESPYKKHVIRKSRLLSHASGPELLGKAQFATSRHLCVSSIYVMFPRPSRTRRPPKRQPGDHEETNTPAASERFETMAESLSLKYWRPRRKCIPQSTSTCRQQSTYVFAREIQLNTRKRFAQILLRFEVFLCKSPCTAPQRRTNTASILWK